MRKRMFLLITAVVCVFVLAGCKCKHQWVDATCETPKTCSKCDEVEGSSLGHAWVEATCTTAKTCKTCGLISGEALGHDWAEATCTAAKTCGICGETEGEPLEHSWVEANYQQPKTCSVCGETEGTPVPGAFEKDGLKAQVAEEGKEYSLKAAEIPFAVVLESVEELEASELHKEREGYEWQKVTIRIDAKEKQTAIGNNAPLYINFVDYYDPETFFSTMKTLYEEGPIVTGFTVNSCGTDYSDCVMVHESFEVIQEAASDENPEGVWAVKITVAMQLPADYDGMLLCVGDAVKLAEEYEGDYQKLFQDENTLFLHLN